MSESFDGRASYYCSNGVEAMDVIEAFDLNFALGSALKYILRAGRKSPNVIEDLEKARAYIDREIKRIRIRIQENPDKCDQDA